MNILLNISGSPEYLSQRKYLQTERTSICMIMTSTSAPNHPTKIPLTPSPTQATNAAPCQVSPCVHQHCLDRVELAEPART